MRTLIRDCTPGKTSADDLNPRTLAGLNKVMAARRVAARSAPPSEFHSFLSRLCAAGALAACLTTSFDGLEARGDPALESKMVMLHGDNRVLRCCRPRCAGLSEEDTMKLDGWWLGSDDAVDPDAHSVLCEECLKKCEYREPGSDISPCNTDFSLCSHKDIDCEEGSRHKDSRPTSGGSP